MTCGCVLQKTNYIKKWVIKCLSLKFPLYNVDALVEQRYHGPLSNNKS